MSCLNKKLFLNLFLVSYSAAVCAADHIMSGLKNLVAQDHESSSSGASAHCLHDNLFFYPFTEKQPKTIVPEIKSAKPRKITWCLLSWCSCFKK